MTHVIFDLLFSNKNYAQKATSTVHAYSIEKTKKGEDFKNVRESVFWHTGMRLNCPPKRHFETFRTEEVQHRNSGKVEMAKKVSIAFEAATRKPLSRASK